MEDIKVNGFFIMDDGLRSCDVVVKQKVKRGGEPAKKMKDRGIQCNLDPEGNPVKGKRAPASKGATQDPQDVDDGTELEVSSPDVTPKKSNKRKKKEMEQDLDFGTPSPPKKRAKVVPAAEADA